MNQIRQLPLVPLGLSVSIFFVITYVLCILSGLIVPDWSMHQPWLQFFPGFEWLTVKGFIIGFVEAVLYGWYAAFLFGWLFNFFAGGE
jgi:hypothetical protein